MKHSKPMFIQAATWHKPPGQDVRGDIQRILVESASEIKSVLAKYANDHLQYWLKGKAALNIKLSRAEQKKILEEDPDAPALLPTSQLGHNYYVFLGALYRGEQPASIFSGAEPQHPAFWQWLSDEPQWLVEPFEYNFGVLINWAIENPVAAAEVLADMRSSPEHAEIFAYESARRFAEAIESVATSKAA